MAQICRRDYLSQGRGVSALEGVRVWIPSNGRRGPPWESTGSASGHIHKRGEEEQEATRILRYDGLPNPRNCWCASRHIRICRSVSGSPPARVLRCNMNRGPLFPGLKFRNRAHDRAGPSALCLGHLRRDGLSQDFRLRDAIAIEISVMATRLLTTKVRKRAGDADAGLASTKVIKPFHRSA